MKPLDQYPTPESDWLYAGDNCVEYAHAADLERKLAACRDTLVCLNNSQIMHPSAHQAIRDILTITAPKQ
jgi:hypothetical protein